MATPDEAAATVAAFEEAYMQMLHRRLRITVLGMGERMVVQLVDVGHDGREHSIISTAEVKISATAAAQVPAVSVKVGY